MQNIQNSYLALLEKIKNEPVIFMFQKMWKYSDSKKLIVLFSGLFLISNALLLVFPLIFEVILNEIQHNGVTENNINLLYLYISSFIGLSLLFWIFHGPARVLEGKNAVETEKNYQEKVIKNVLSQDLSWHTEKQSGDIIDKIEKGRTALFNFSRSFYNFIAIVINTIGIFIMISLYNQYISLFLFIAIILAVFLIITFDTYLVVKYKEINKYQNKITAKIFDSISNITSIVILNIKEKIGLDITKGIEKPIPLYINTFILNEAKWFSLSMVLHSLTSIPLAFYIYYNYSHNILIEAGSISALYMYLRKLTDSFMSFGGRYDDVVRQKTNMLNAEELENLDMNTADNIKNKRKQKFINWKEIYIQTLGFGYNKNKLDVNIKNLVLKKGEKIAVIGESGGGKTTFLKLLHGLYKSAKSEIIITEENNTEKKLNTNFTDINIKSTLVPQEPELFSSTILENITFGIDFSAEEIQEILEISKCNVFIEKLPNKINSKVNEKGVNLSGGQKQRIALARALLFAKNKELILLDESTSSVDPKNEAEIYNNIFNTFKNTTIIASIHKMNLLKYFDTIVIFDKGEIVDSGSFEYLMKTNSDFKKNWEEYVKSNA
ncbi:TPA: ABC transporter ATP-binding protein [Candidatus Gracilibacteria bacterium]|nr:ABC transporter ATP-binding protein [Candidatus Gracilibacteria bacterium]